MNCTWYQFVFIPNIYTITTLDMFFILFIVIVDLWNVNKISISTNKYIFYNSFIILKGQKI